MTVSEGLPLNSKYIKMGRKVMRGKGKGKDICLLEVLQTRLCERKKS